MANQKSFSKKVVVWGAPSVGKTSLISRFVYQKFSDSYLTTIGMKIDKKTVFIDDYTIDMVLWEVGGQERLIENFMRGSEGVIYVIDISRPETYEDLGRIWDFLERVAPDAEKVIIANKVDLISSSELKAIIKKLDIEPDFYSSAKTGECVEEMFEHLAARLVENYKNR